MLLLLTNDVQIRRSLVASIVQKSKYPEFFITKGLQHLAVGTRSGFHKAAVGLHCCHTRAATTQAQSIHEQLKKCMKYFWYLGGFRSLVKSIVTDSLGMFNDIIPSTNAIKVHLTSPPDKGNKDASRNHLQWRLWRSLRRSDWQSRQWPIIV